MKGLRKACVAVIVPIAVVAAGFTTAVQAAPGNPDPGHVERASEPIPGQYIVTLRGVPRAAVPGAASDLARAHHGTTQRVY